MPILPRCRRPLRRALTLVLVLVSLVTSGCAGTSLPSATDTLDKVVWPPPPLEPRVAWVKQIADSGEAGVKAGGWKKVVTLLFGEENFQIARPYGIHVDAKKRILVADPGARVLHVIDRAGGSYKLVRPEPAGFLSPIGVTEDLQEQVYVTDSAAGTVFRFGLEDYKMRPFITRGLSRPTGIAYSPVTDLIYVSDTLAGQVVAFDRSGVESFRFGTPGEMSSQFNRPTDLAVDRQGRVLVTDALNGRIQMFDGKGRFLKGFGERGDASGTFAKPKGVAVDSRGNLHVCDALFDTVQVFTEAGELLLSYGSRGGGRGELWMPSGIFIDGDDTIYVADTYNNRIQLYQLLNDVTEK